VAVQVRTRSALLASEWLSKFASKFAQVRSPVRRPRSHLPRRPVARVWPLDEIRCTRKQTARQV